MNFPFRSSLLLLAAFSLQVLDAATPAGAGRSSFDMLVVAERSKQGAAISPSSADQPVSYYACDGGYIEAGDPVAGDNPPSAGVVARALEASLADAGYHAAAAGSTPSLVLIYHWGVLRPSRLRHSTLSRLDPNLRARLSLVTTAEILKSFEQRLILSKQGFETMGNLGVRPSERDAVDFARDARYFVIVSAYDYPAMTHGQATLLWRTKLSARDTSGAMDEALVSLIAGGSSSFGRDFRRPKSLAVPLIRTVAQPDDRTAGVASIPPALASAVDAHWLQALIQDEHKRFSGEYRPNDDDSFPPASARAETSR